MVSDIAGRAEVNQFDVGVLDILDQDVFRLQIVVQELKALQIVQRLQRLTRNVLQSLQVEVLRLSARGGKAFGEAFVNGNLACSAELMFIAVEK